MMHMLRRIFAVLLVLAALLSCAFADDSVEPCADVTFLSATCSLGMDKVATFTLMTISLPDALLSPTHGWNSSRTDAGIYVKTAGCSGDNRHEHHFVLCDPLLFQRDYDQRHVPNRLHCGCGWPSNHPLFQQPPFHLILFSDSPALFPFWHPAASFSAALLRGIPLPFTRTKNSRHILNHK